MRKIFYGIAVVSILFISCFEDRDDRIFNDSLQEEGLGDDELEEGEVENDGSGDDEQDNDPDDEEQEAQRYISTETQWISQDTIVYFTGGLECSVDGTYFFDRSKQVEGLEIPADLPDSLDLSEFLPPIGNQGRQGSCTSWATTYYMKSMQERIESGEPYTEDQIMSPSYTYNQISQGICEGTSFENTLNILKNKGAVPMETFGYLDYSCNIQPSPTMDAEAESNKISDYEYLSGENMVSEMKTLLNEQIPVLISAFLDSEFGLKDEFGLTAYREHDIDYSVPGGCHAMLVVGYSDRYNAFKVVNSWGANWGDNGFVWIDYAAFENVNDNSTGFRVINQAIVAYDL